MVCSSFTRRAKPATQKVADGERMNPGEERRVRANTGGDAEHQGDEHLENSSRHTLGLPARDPLRMALVAPLFHPLPSYADAAGSSLHQRRGEPRTPSSGH